MDSGGGGGAERELPSFCELQSSPEWPVTLGKCKSWAPQCWLIEFLFAIQMELLWDKRKDTVGIVGETCPKRVVPHAFPLLSVSFYHFRTPTPRVFLMDPGKPGLRSMGLYVCPSKRPKLVWLWLMKIPTQYKVFSTLFIIESHKHEVANIWDESVQWVPYSLESHHLYLSSSFVQWALSSIKP